MRLLESANGLERLRAVVTDRDFFPLLGVSPVAGRAYAAGDPSTVAVISADLWRRMFEGDPGVLGRTVALSGTRWDPALKRSVLVRRDFTIIGIMPPRFQFPYGASSAIAGAMPETRTDIWIPDERPNGGRLAFVTGRLKAGATRAAAENELNAIEARRDVTAPGPYRALGVRLQVLTDDVLGAVRPSLWLLFGAVGLVLAGACANVANLLLARTAGRLHEIAARAALGAAPSRLGRQFLVESLLLSLAGGTVGVFVAHAGLGLLTALGSAKIPRAHEIAIDWWTFAFLFAICALSAIVFGLSPALIASRADALAATRDAGRATMSNRYVRLRDALVVIEVALAFVLAFGVAGVIRELGRLERVDPGIETSNVISLHVTPRIPDADYLSIERRVRQIPGVAAAGFIQLLPLQNWGWLGDFHVRGRPESERPTVELRTVTPGYFVALGIPVRGRHMTDADSTVQPQPIWINETLARQHFAGEDPIGRETDRGIIVGVVGDVRQARLDRTVAPEIYGPVNVNAGMAADLGMSFVVRTESAPETVVPAIRAAVRETNSNVAIFNVKTMPEVVADSLWELRLYRWLVGLFALLALVLAAIGLYGVISYGVSSRMREFAVRLALGSEPARLARLVLTRGLRLAGAGLALGGVCALMILPVLRSFRSGIVPDAPTFAAIALILVAVAVAACAVPAIRVAGLNPASALRRE